MVYPVVNVDKAVTQKVYADDVQYATDTIPGATFAERVNKAFRFYEKYNKREELIVADVGVGLSRADSTFEQLVDRISERLKHG